MGDEFLKKINGFSRTFVIRSKNGPLAAAAAMGMMSNRSQAVGSYFRVSDLFIPDVDILALSEDNIDSDPKQIEIDFKRDWVSYLRSTALPACGVEYKDSCTPSRNTIRFLNAQRRRIPAIKPRTIHESSELTIPLEYRSDYEKLVTIILAGGDLKPYLSRATLIGRSDKNDRLLNSWGIHHLHFRSDGCEQLLFCVITESDIYMISVLPHNDWVNTRLVQILHDNWPALIGDAKRSGLLPEVFSAGERSSLREYNTNFPITVGDGTVYLPPTGGTMASGDSQEDMVNCDKIFLELDYWQGIITREVPAIRMALDVPTGHRLVVRMAYNNRDCCFYDAMRGIRLGGFSSGGHN